MLVTNIKFPVFLEDIDNILIKNKRYSISQKQHKETLHNTTLKDKHEQEIYFFDLLLLDGKTSNNTTKNKDYFLCTWDKHCGRIDFLYFSYEIKDFIWFDHMRSNYFIKIANASEILYDNKKGIKIPKQVLSKIKTMMDGTNEYCQKCV